MLSKAKDYYTNNKKKLKKQARDKYINLFDEEKNKIREYGKNRYHNMSQEKNNIKQYKKKIFRDTIRDIQQTTPHRP